VTRWGTDDLDVVAALNGALGVQTLPKCPIRGFEDFAVWYLGGVDAPPR
jgi:hypothetical protein